MRSRTGGDDRTYNSLLRRWHTIVTLCLLFIASGFVLLRVEWGLNQAFRWILFTTMGITYLMIVLRHNLRENHLLEDSALLPTLGWGNGLTILRGILVAGLSGFLLLPRPVTWLVWIPGILYTLSDATDFFDGFIARRTNHVTRLGGILDMSLDGVGVLVAALLAVKYGQVPVWYLGVALVRYVYIGALWLRKRRGLPIYELPDSTSRRVFAGLQMGFLAAMLWPLFSPPGTHVAAAAFALPFLAGFVRDWLVSSGVITSTSLSPRRYLGRSSSWLPIFSRISILLISLNMLIPIMSEFQSTSPQLLIFIILEFLVAFLIATGTAGRVASILGLLLLGYFQMSNVLGLSHYLLVPAYALILFSGTGPYSFWKPEDALVFNRLGERTNALLERGG